MSRQPGLSEWTDLVSTHMPHRSVPQARVLALWSYGIALTRSCGRLTVATFLALLMAQKVATVEQRLYEWCCDTLHKAGTKRQTLDVTTCFMPLLRWIVALWSGTQLALALDAHELGGTVCGPDPQCGLSRLCPPRGMDRVACQPAWRLAAGMVAPVATGASCHPTGLDGAGAGGPRFVGTLALPAYCPPGRGIRCCGSTRARSSALLGQTRWFWLRELVREVSQCWRGRGTAFVSPACRLDCTLVAWWGEGYTDPWFLLTDLAPEGE